jgi:hypothetical protein
LSIEDGGGLERARHVFAVVSQRFGHDQLRCLHE